ncbi:hypothetical protein A3D05_01565 [Candidatus Gottesmanbacteria bacterium RIFCSPHIGHO2_02_FULL_40_24]|nr:MAG: hypothetical protein A3D05_01565 [Candidatus Gottesmanbacteria bacterium RIFCSPHIGHO2_02_FULL_40_24]
MGEKQKIFIVLLILAVLISGIIYIRKRNSSVKIIPEVQIQEKEETFEDEEIKGGSIFLSTDTPLIKVGSEATVSVNFGAYGKNIFGSDVILLFDPEYLSTDENMIEPGDFFTSIPRKTVDTDNGIIKITAIEGRDEVLTEEVSNAFSIRFRGLKPGSSVISFSFIKNETNTTTLVERGSSQNLLDEVQSETIDIEE